MQWSKLATCNGLGLGPECAHCMKQPNDKEVQSLNVGLIGKANLRLCGLLEAVRWPEVWLGTEPSSNAITFRKQKRRALRKTIPPHSPIATITTNHSLTVLGFSKRFSGSRVLYRQITYHQWQSSMAIINGDHQRRSSMASMALRERTSRYHGSLTARLSGPKNLVGLKKTS